MNKLESLKKNIARSGSAVIAFSGGVDSTFLAAVAKEVLGNKALLVTAVSETYSKGELKDAVFLAKRLKLQHMLIKTREFDDRQFVSNPPERCYYCKKELFKRLWEIARRKKIKNVLDGSNFDDLSDFRPGSKAKKELGVRSPLQEAGFTKADIRYFSKRMGLPTWDKPACACLASRIPYGDKITNYKLQMIEKAEKMIRNIFGEKASIRVRMHGDIARIELEKRSIKRLFKGDIIEKIAGKLKKIGFSYVTVDLEGFRSGSMNEIL
mgnify:CR=1 FL=1